MKCIGSYLIQAAVLALLCTLPSTRLWAMEENDGPADSSRTLFAAVSTGNAQQTGSGVVGTVIDAETRLPIENAKVEVMGTDKAAVTQRDGQYRILGLERGIFQIRASGEGYTAEMQNNIRIEPGREQELFFALRKTAKPAQNPSYSIESVPSVRRNPYPIYPSPARRRRLEGTIWVKLLVNEEGRVNDAVLINSVYSIHGQNIAKGSMSPVVAQAAKTLVSVSLEAARRWEFQPAVAKGRPIRAWVTVPFKFSLEHGRAYRAH